MEGRGDNCRYSKYISKVFRYLAKWIRYSSKKIEKNISDDELNEFRNSQESWVAFYETNPNIAVDIYSDRMGTGTIIHEIYGNKALFMKRYRVLELAEYCYLLTGNFEFNFNP